MSERLGRGQEDEMRAVVLAYVAEHGPLPFSDIWQPLADRMSDTYVKLTLKSLVERGEVIETTEEITREVRSGFGQTREAIYLGAVYRVATSKTAPARSDSQVPRPSGPISRRDSKSHREPKPPQE